MKEIANDFFVSIVIIASHDDLDQRQAFQLALQLHTCIFGQSALHVWPEIIVGFVAKRSMIPSETVRIKAGVRVFNQSDHMRVTRKVLLNSICLLVEPTQRSFQEDSGSAMIVS